jgi:hypothetical protein
METMNHTFKIGLHTEKKSKELRRKHIEKLMAEG